MVKTSLSSRTPNGASQVRIMTKEPDLSDSLGYLEAGELSRINLFGRSPVLRTRGRRGMPGGLGIGRK